MSLWSLAANYLTGGLAGAINTAQQNAMTSQQMEWQSAENQKNRDFSMQMYNQQLQDYLQNYPTLLKQQSDEQFNLWKNQFNSQNAYNSPSASVARSLVAGLNPAAQNGLVTGQNSQMGAQASVSPPPQIHGSPLGGTASPIGIPSVLGTDLLREVGQFARNIAEAKKSNKEVSRYDELIDSQIELYIQKAASEQAYADYQDTQNQILKCFGYKQAAQNVVKTYQECYKLKTEGKLNEALEKLNESQRLLNDDKHAMNMPYVEHANELFELNRKALQADIREKNANAFEASESGKLKHAQTETEGVNKELRELERDILRPDADSSVLEKRTKALLDDWEAKGWISAANGKEAELRFSRLWDTQGKRENSWFREFDSASDWLKTKLSIFK